MKVLLIPNFPGWAYDIIATRIKKYGSFDYDIVYEKEYRHERFNEEPIPIDFDKYDRVLNFAPFQDWVNLPYEKTVCIFWERNEINGYNYKKYRNVITSTPHNIPLFNGYERVHLVSPGYDPEIFEMKLSQKHNPLVVGWCGSKSGHKKKKGYEKYYLPLGEHFELKPHLKEEDFIPYEKMPEYYESIDVLVVTSSWEGACLPIIEATACGVPVVSTDVGVAPLIIPESQIVKRDVDAFVKRLKAKNFTVPDISDWVWDKRVKQWEEVIAK